jgi:hypothetical protein
MIFANLIYETIVLSLNVISRALAFAEFDHVADVEDLERTVRFILRVIMHFVPLQGSFRVDEVPIFNIAISIEKISIVGFLKDDLFQDIN